MKNKQGVCLDMVRENINVASIVGILIVLIVGLSVLPIVIDSVAAAAASLTGAAQTMVNFPEQVTPVLG